MKRFLAIFALLFLVGVFVAGWLFWQNGRLPTSAYIIYYLAPDGNGRYQIFMARFDAAGQTVQRQAITQATADIIFFALSPANQLAYVVQETATDTAVWLAGPDGRSPKQLLACPHSSCNQLVWHPDGRRLIYERRDLAAMGSPRLWWLDTKTGQSLTVLADESGVSSGAQFSATGEWLSYVAHGTDGVEVYNFENGRRLNFSSATGRSAVWSPVADVLLVSDFDLVVFHGNDESDHLAHSHNYVQSVHLFLTSLDGFLQLEIGGGLPSDDASPAWSPDGAWLVVGRTLPRTVMGRQLWLMRPDGQEARPLTDELEIHHGLPSWSADGRYILYQRFAAFANENSASIWLLDIENGEQVEIAKVGHLPAWQYD